jgi:23S rRNA pseudouridine2605 synthase
VVTKDGERIQKVMASTGIASRREAEAWIKEGKVSVNGRVIEVGAKVNPNDRILVNGKPLRIKQQKNAKVLAYHKPVGEICSRKDPAGRKTVFEALPRLRGSRWISVGRLDYNTSGLLLFTTDGELANRLTHPSSRLEREYLCRVQGTVDKDFIAELKDGVDLDGKTARFEKIDFEGGVGSNRWYRVVLREGRYREVRRMWGAGGYRVSRLMRVRYGPMQLPRELKPGNYMNITPEASREFYALD